MKKGSVVNGENSNPPKRKRSDGSSLVREEPAAAEGVAMGRRATSRLPLGEALLKPDLGGALKSWSLPDIGSAKLNFASSWQDAEDSSTSQQEETPQMPQRKTPAGSQQEETPQMPQRKTPAGVNALSHEDDISTIYPHSISIAAGPSDTTKSTATMTSTFFSTDAAIRTSSGPSTQSQLASGNSVPKACLYTYYGKKPRRKQIANDDYFSWNNGGMPHELKFTAIFQCPLTGECFASGRYGDPANYISSNVENKKGEHIEVIWYTKKAFAEHGAAARCYDCLTYRQAVQEGVEAVKSLDLLGNDPPYLREHQLPLPPMPAVVQEKINENTLRIHQMVNDLPQAMLK